MNCCKHPTEEQLGASDSEIGNNTKTIVWKRVFPQCVA